MTTMTIDPEYAADLADDSTPLPRPRRGVVHTDDTVDHYLVDVNGERVFPIDITAGRVFDLCERGATRAAAVAALCANLKVPGQEARARDDVQKAVAQLQALGLCERAAPSEQR